ncbi:hypothetical protein A3B57_00970 [Microgenomates group bacterium RIFCSPLOWO2_01_FULL_47_10]|nr:MAG: hypothetical protein A3B57_00970 [Microgenomates group bacterium RIFCSPLOWO2_01_FULL_47_10]
MTLSLKARSFNVDLIRVVAALMVVYMHTVYNFSIRVDFFATKLWWLLEPLTALSKTCVLLFFMLSGYLVIGKKRSIRENWLKTKQRILIPLLFFGALNIVYAAYLYHFTSANTPAFWQGQLIRITNYPSSPLWFLIVLAYLYLLNPVWHILFTNQQTKTIAVYITKLFFTLSIALMFIAFPSGKVGTIFNFFTSWVGFACFYLYGGLVANRWVSFANQKINTVLMSTGMLLTFVGDVATGWADTHQGSFVWADYTGNFLSLPVIILAVGLFNYLISADYKVIKASGQKLMAWLAGLSLGVYLVHTYIVSILTDLISFNFDQISMNVYLYLVVNFCLVLGSSMIVTLVIKSTPYLRKIIGE